MPETRYLRTVPLPEDLKNENLFEAMQKTRDFFALIYEKTGIKLSEVMQANNFSGLVSNVFTKMLSACSVYHAYSDQRYPDLVHAEKGIGLEVKASNKPMKGGEGHNGHSGWHLVVCFAVLDNSEIEFSQIEIADLIGFEREDSDWKYQKSSRNQNNSQRTETYVTTTVGTAKLRDGTVYLDPRYASVTAALRNKRQKLQSELPIPEYSPFKQS